MSKSLPSTEVYSKINHKEPEALRQAKLTAARYWKFSRDMLFSMRTIPIKGLGTMAVDRFLNLYYDPEYVEGIYTSPRELSSCLMHEMCHILMDHHRRFDAIVKNPTPVSRQKWNEACDITINYLLDQEWQAHKEDGYSRDFRVGYNWLMHNRPPYVAIPEITGNQTAEKVFRILMKGIEDGQGQDNQDDSDRSDRSSNTGEDSGSTARSERQAGDDPRNLRESGSGEGEDDHDDRGDTSVEGSSRDTSEPVDGRESGDSERNASDGSAAESNETASDGYISVDESGHLVWNGEPIPEPGAGGNGSSITDGSSRLWESAGQPEGSMSEGDVESLITSACHKAQGSLGDDISFALKDVMRSISKISEDPWSMILRLTRGKLNSFRSRGGKRTYRRINRRGIGHGICRPVKRSGKPQLAICLDTSGSMGGDDYDKAYAVIKKLLDNLGANENVCVITGDVAAKTKRVINKHVSDSELKNLELNGGGGTDVGVLIEDTIAQAKPTPDVIVAITDGYTPWPSQSSTPVLAVVTQELDKHWEVPGHITKIVLKG